MEWRKLHLQQPFFRSFPQTTYPNSHQSSKCPPPGSMCRLIHHVLQLHTLIHLPHPNPNTVWLLQTIAFLLSIYCACCMPSRFSCIWLFATLWTTPCQAPLSTGFSRQEYKPTPGKEWVSMPSVYCTSPKLVVKLLEDRDSGYFLTCKYASVI